MSKEKLKVLIVEDNPTDALVVKKRLQKDSAFDYEVTHVVSGEEALLSMENNTYDIALLDYNLPKMGGMEILAEIKRKNIEVPVVMVTGQGDEIVAAQLIKEGALDYLPKRENYEDAVPFMIRKTIAEFRSMLERARLQKEIALRKEELEKTNAKLMELDRMKSDFVANVVHELRTPLTIIKGNLDNIDKGFAGEVHPKQKEIMGDIFRVISRLSRLVNDLLDLSKIESGKMELNKECLDIVKLAEETAKTFETLAASKKIGIVREFPSKQVIVKADRDKLTQVFVNFIGNAVKFTDRGNVTVRIIDLEGEAQVEIQDTGPGIPEDQTDKIFDKFVRVVAEKKEGTGLGLPIAKDIIVLHKGRVRVESETGKGSRFIFVIPK
ncbi:MAG: hybrid sensor histidine kinase/response regulator [Candidatus Omnitrophota bacterium]|nr:hybrid sensor histidine kinase/response regulator [Candidatus Omnitrophota bacterium]